MKLKCHNKTIGALAAGLLSVWAVTEARAAFVNYTIGDGGLVGGFTGTIDGTPIGGGEAFQAGGIQLTKTSGGPGLPDSYTTICTDIGGTLFLGDNYGFSAPQPFAPAGIAPAQWGVTPAFGASAIENAAQLFYQYGISGGVLGGSDLDAKAGLQLAVWEALYDTGAPLGVGGGLGTRFKITGGDAAAIADANFDLAGLTGFYSYSGFLLVPDPTVQFGLVSQELMIGGSVSDFIPVPEPGGYALAASVCGVLCAVGARLRRGKRAKD